jgi:hypothetical protein
MSKYKNLPKPVLEAAIKAGHEILAAHALGKPYCQDFWMAGVEWLHNHYLNAAPELDKKAFRLWEKEEYLPMAGAYTDGGEDSAKWQHDQLSSQIAALKAENERWMDAFHEVDKERDEWRRRCEATLREADIQRNIGKELTAARTIIEKLAGALKEIKSEIEHGKTKHCIGCCNGNDIPDEELCRACWRIWVKGECYFLWDWKTTEKRLEVLSAYKAWKGEG